MFKIIKFFAFFIFYFSLIDVFSKETQLECKIVKEIENNMPAEKKKYESTFLKIYFDEKEKWINDISKKNWLQSESHQKSNFMFKENENFFFF